MDALSKLLTTREWILADNATATSLLGAVEPAPQGGVETLNLGAPEAVLAHHRASLAAGADVILTNSFAANGGRAKISVSGGPDLELYALNRAAAQIAREAAEGAEREIVVAGSLGPTGQIMAPMGSLSHAGAVEIYHAQAEALKEGGADLLWFETLSSAEELRAAAEAALLTGMEWTVTMSFDTAGQTMMGLTPARLAAAVEQVTHKPLAFGANCGVSASDNLRAIAELGASGSERPLIAKGNAGIAHQVGARLEYDGTPGLMADYAALARDLGCRIIGGCCGTTPAHLAAMRDALTDRPRAPRPTLDLIAERLGSFTS